MKFVFIFLLLTCSLNATIYYVRTDGSNGNAGTSNTSGGAWLTIDFAADNVLPGDIVRVQAGTYEEIVTPAIDGTAGNLITFIADGAVILCGLDLSSNDYQRWIDFEIDTSAGTCVEDSSTIVVTGTNTFMEFWNLTLHETTSNAFRPSGTDRMHNSLIMGGEIYDIGNGGGSAVGINMYGDDNVVAHVDIHDVYPDGLAGKGNDNYYLNLYIHDTVEMAGGHADGFQYGSSTTQGWERNTGEGWFYVGTAAAADNHFYQISNAQGNIGVPVNDNFFRRIVIHLTGAGHGINAANDGDITHTSLYHITEVDTQNSSTGIRYGFVWQTAGNFPGVVVNNIHVNAWSTNIALATAKEVMNNETGNAYLLHNHNLVYDTGGTATFHSQWTNQANEQTNADPDFTNHAGDDFTLGASSAATNNGGPITFVNEPVDTTGTTFTVDYGGHIRGDNTDISHYGGNLILGDTITIGTDVRVVVSVSGNDITVDSSLTWADNDPVYYGSDTTPDIGAYPASHTPLTSATIAQAGNDYTVTPDGDTRWVVFYQDGIPSVVDNAAPFTATIASGTVTAKAFCLYPSKTPVILATAGGGGGSSSLSIGGAATFDTINFGN